jgi:hypothetical protein
VVQVIQATSATSTRGRLLLYTVQNDRKLRRIICNYGSTGLKLAENAATPEGYIELIRHLEFFDEKQEYAIEPARQYAGVSFIYP